MKSFKTGLCFLLLGAAIACKKGKSGSGDDDSNGGGGAPTTGTRSELSLDSLYLYAREVYLWYDKIPANYSDFTPRKYNTESTDLASLTKEMFAISQLAVNPATNKPYEYNTFSPTHAKYSYVVNKEGVTGGRMGSVSLEEKGEDFGFELGAVAPNDIRVLFVNPASPAFVAGLVRGDKILTINGAPVTSSSSSLTTAFNNSSMTLTVQKADNSVAAYNLGKATYTSNPVLKSAVLTGNVGYIALARFSRLSKAQAAMDAAFSSFSQKGVKKLIIDLRYNGGGYVNTAEHLLNLIAPASLNDKVAYTESYNELLRIKKAPILKQQVLYNEDGTPRKLSNGEIATYYNVSFSVADNTMKFAKAGALEGVTHVYFIITRNTASASELVINALKPYLNVKTIGSKSYGKPVGFFAINIDKYSVYMSSFLIKNSAGSAEYFDGMEAEVAAQDDARFDFGNENEDGVKKALAALAANGRMAQGTPVETRYAPEAAKVENGMIRTFEKQKLVE